jgi:hypothetical protein
MALSKRGGEGNVTHAPRMRKNADNRNWSLTMYKPMTINDQHAAQAFLQTKTGKRVSSLAFLLAAGVAFDAAATQNRLDRVNGYCVPRNVTLSCNACHGSNFGAPTAGKAAYNANNLDFFCASPLVNAPPTLNLSPSGDQAVTEGQAGRAIKVTASDADPVSVTVAPNPLPPGADWNPATGVFNYAPPAGTATATPTVTFAFTAADAPANGAQAKSVTQNVSFHVSAPGAQPNSPPLLTGPSTVNVAAGDGAFAFEIAASDPDGDPLELSAAHLPAGLNFTVGQNAMGEPVGLFSWAPDGPSADLARAAPYSLTVVAKDSHNAQTAKEIKLYVNAVANPGGANLSRLVISKAYWQLGSATLSIAGAGKASKGIDLNGIPVRVTDAFSGAVLGETALNARGAWKIAANLGQAPCLVRVEAGGQIAFREVDRAPVACHANDADGDDDADGHDGDDRNDIGDHDDDADGHDGDDRNDIGDHDDDADGHDGDDRNDIGEHDDDSREGNEGNREREEENRRSGRD